EQSDLPRHDNGRTGDGFFFAGRAVEASGNVAANTTNGYVWMHRSAPTLPTSENLDQPEIAHGGDEIIVSKTPIHTFNDNEAFGTVSGLIVVKANPAQDHDVRTVMDGFLSWETAEGANFSYTAHYTLKDFDFVGAQGSVPPSMQGLGIGGNTFDMAFNGIRIEGFDVGVDYSGNNAVTGPTSELDTILIDAEFINVGQTYSGRDPGRHTVISSSDLSDVEPSFTFTGDSVLSPNETFYFDGFKTDSIGTDDRQYFLDRQQIARWDVPTLLDSEGYYRLPDGTPVVLIEDFVADRATGDLTKYALIVQLDYPSYMLDGLAYNGVIAPGGPAPTAMDDSAVTTAGEDVLIDVIANDSDPDGGAIWIDGTTDPENGDIFIQDDGTILYRANRGFTGEDEFTYWARDEEANFTQATVTVTVLDDIA
ncbi:MAG: Ig-like domain-containing protein, partial [Pseudomonadota bacterium]